MKATRADAVVTVEGLKENFFKRHGKDLKRAREAWDGLVTRRERLAQDTGTGEPIPRNRWPKTFRDLPNLYLIPELAHRFRARYTVIRHPTDGVLVRIEWIGDHQEYDDLFGYKTS
jgi:hypothetical protein